MIDLITLKEYLLLFAMCYLSITIFFCLIRAVLGPRFTDRLVAVNIIGVKGLVLILVSAYYLHNSLFIDISIVYALLSFLSVVVLSKLFLKSRQDRVKLGKERVVVD